MTGTAAADLAARYRGVRRARIHEHRLFDDLLGGAVEPPDERPPPEARVDAPVDRAYAVDLVRVAPHERVVFRVDELTHVVELELAPAPRARAHVDVVGVGDRPRLGVAPRYVIGVPIELMAVPPTRHARLHASTVKVGDVKHSARARSVRFENVEERREARPPGDVM